MCKVISVANQKGGVAKSTTTLNLGVGLVKQGKRVLLIDADPQGSLTASLGYVEPDDIGTTLATIMMGVINEEEIVEEEGILHHGIKIQVPLSKLATITFFFSILHITRHALLNFIILILLGSLFFLILDSLLHKYQ